MSDQQPERRKARRIEIRLPIVCRAADGSAIPGVTENVSRRGMLLVVKQSASPGTPIRVAFTGGDGRERELQGEVKRTTPDGKLGVEFPESDAPVLDDVLRAPGDSPAS
jgi:hypothetical protein